MSHFEHELTKRWFGILENPPPAKAATIEKLAKAFKFSRSKLTDF